MAKEIIDLRKELREYMLDFDMIQKIDCSKEDRIKYVQMIKSNLPLPNGVFQRKDLNGLPIDQFYTIYENDLSNAEKQELLTYRKLALLRTIRNCCVFFTVITIIGISVSIIIALNLGTM